MNINLQWNQGYVFFVIVGLIIWVGVPAINTAFDISVMTSELTVPIFGTRQINVLLGGAMIAGGVLSYIDFRVR